MFLVIDRDGVVLSSRVPWETIQRLLGLMMVRRHPKKHNCFCATTLCPEQMLKIRNEIKRKIGGSCIAEAQNTVSKKHFVNEHGSGWYYQPNLEICSTYAASVERLMVANN